MALINNGNKNSNNLSFSSNDNELNKILSGAEFTQEEIENFTVEQIGAIVACGKWNAFINYGKNNPDSSVNSEEIKKYFDTYGFTRDKKLNYNALQGKDIDSNILQTIIGDFIDGKVDPSEFCREAPSSLKDIYPTLSTSKIKLLQKFIDRELLLREVDIKDLSDTFPFPITKVNFFGRFIGGVADTPHVGIRHLKSGTPFFIQLLSLLEGLSNDKKSFLQISSLSMVEKFTNKNKEEDNGDSNGKNETKEFEEIREVSEEIKELKKEFLEVLISCIENAKDLCNDSTIRQLKAINLPRFPIVKTGDMTHIDKKEMRKLSLEIMEWIFTGKKDGILLNRKSLPIYDKKRLASIEKTEIPRQLKKQRVLKSKIIENEKKLEIEEIDREHISSYMEDLKTQKNKVKELEIITPLKNRKKDPNQEKLVRIKSKITTIERRIKRLELELIDVKKELEILKREKTSLKSDKRHKKPLIKELEGGGAEAFKTDIRTFRKEVNNAVLKGDKIVFTTFENPVRESVFAMFFDKAFSQKGQQSKELLEILTNCSFLMSDEFVASISLYKTNGQSCTKTHFRNFHFDESSLNQSARYVVDEMLPQKENLSTRKVTDFLLRNIPITGVQLKSQLKYLVGQDVGKRTPNINEYLEYVFEKSTRINKEVIIKLLELLNEVGHIDFPEKCKKIAKNRHHIPTNIIDQFMVYSHNYKPHSLGNLPGLFEDYATLRRYLDLGLDSYGVEQEVQGIIKGLTNGRGVIGIIDTTEYHPELVKDISGVSEKEGAENTDELWGQYIRPSERIIRSLSSRLIEGRVPDELKNHSFVSVRQPEKLDKVIEKLYKSILGIDIHLTPDMSQISHVFSELSNYDENIVIVIDAQNVKNLEQYKDLINLLEKFRFKVLLKLKEPLPGLPQVTVKPFLDSEVAERIYKEESSIRQKLSLEEEIDKDILQFTVGLVKKMRQPSDDPLNLALQVLNGSAQNARMNKFSSIKEQDITLSISPIFHLPDSDQMRSRIDAIDEFIKIAPLQVMGQGEAIKQMGKKMKSHILALRDPTRPLTLLIPGPTGVGKTELMMLFAQAVNMPLFMIEGAEFSEAHTVSRLVGSPSGYVGPDEGILFKFLKDNNAPVIFIDEIEKMHPDVYTALMNFFDKATLTAGDGTSVRRPGSIIVGASNAGADDLKRGMSIRDIKSILSSAFVDRNGKSRPELVRRFDPILMLAIEQDEFRKVIRLSLEAIGNRFGLISANLRVQEIDDASCDILYEDCKDACKYEETQSMGFGGIRTVETGEATYYDMRHISRALDSLVSDSMVEIVQDQMLNGDFNNRDTTTKVKLVGDKANNTITMEIIPKNSEEIYS